jgi:hypothetical protein
MGYGRAVNSRYPSVQFVPLVFSVIYKCDVTGNKPCIAFNDNDNDCTK